MDKSPPPGPLTSGFVSCPRDGGAGGGRRRWGRAERSWVRRRGGLRDAVADQLRVDRGGAHLGRAAAAPRRGGCGAEHKRWQFGLWNRYNFFPKTV